MNYLQNYNISITLSCTWWLTLVMTHNHCVSWFTSWQLPFSFCLLSVSCVCLIPLSPPPLSVFLCMGVVSLPGVSHHTNQPLHKTSGFPVTRCQFILEAWAEYSGSWLIIKIVFSDVCSLCSFSDLFLLPQLILPFYLPACMPAWLPVDCLFACFAVCSSSPAVAGRRYPPSILGTIHQHVADNMYRRLRHYGNDRWEKETLHPPPPALLAGTRDPSTPLFLFAPWYSHCVTNKYHFELVTWVEFCVWVQSLTTITLWAH